MQQIISISEDDIIYAQKILLSEGMSFDAERREFISNLETIDLHASPGSGKTTALLAKLLILAKHFPFKNNSGILVLSHTNSAVDEIHEKIARYCPHLFNYPNYVGTIQSFVNKFLAIPSYINLFNKRPNSIDHEIYCEKVQKYSLPYGANAWVNRKSNASTFLEMIRFDSELNLINGINGIAEKFDLKDPSKATYKALSKMKVDLLRAGTLHYDDAYFLANSYINEYIVSVLQNRFSHVFVDEMQDMDKHQHDLLENIFFLGEDNKSIFQRIGDKNQSIYNGNVKLENIWSDRENKLNLNGSHRLTENIADLVNCFALDRDEGFHIDGLKEGDIKPHLIIYDDTSIEQVIPVFSEIINRFIDEGKIPQSDGVYKAISWTKNHDVHISLSDYYPGFSVSSHSSENNYPYMTDYIYCCNNSDDSLKHIYRNIIKILLRVLKLEDVTDSETGKYFTKTSLLNYLYINNRSYSESLKSNLYHWSFDVACKKEKLTVNLIRDHIPILLNIFNKEITGSNDFIHIDGPEAIVDNNTGNIIDIHGFDIEMSTIHSVKGQTHTGTLYLESYYQGSYETEKLSEQFCGVNFDDDRVYHKQSTKMAYVGLSRPTHLLCVALNRERYDLLKENLDISLWEVREV